MPDYSPFSTVYLALTLCYFLAASIVTFDIRLHQDKNAAQLPAGIFVFYAAQWIIFAGLVVLNWKAAIVVFAVKFCLKVLPVLEIVGAFLAAPLMPKGTEKGTKK